MTESGIASPASPTLAPQRPLRQWMRGLRPLFYWLILVLLLYAYRTHERLSANTKVHFSVSSNGRSLYLEAKATLDGSPVENGSLVSIGRHTLEITHPKCEPISSNIFIWYGVNQLSDIRLTRNTGVLDLKISPPARTLRIRGPEFSRTLTNSAGEQIIVPTDDYAVLAQFTYLEDTRQVSIERGSTQVVSIMPRFGTLRLESKNTDASFQLVKRGDGVQERGKLPSKISELPEGMYEIVAIHRNSRRKEELGINAGETNLVTFDFSYGAAAIATDPAGASVLGPDGREFGSTPLIIPDLEIGKWSFSLRAKGFEPIQAEVEIKADSTNAFRATLTSTTYLGAIKAARRYFENGNFALAIEAANEALRVKGNDSEAEELKRRATGMERLRLARENGKAGNYQDGIANLEAALEALPGNQEARQLLEKFKEDATRARLAKLGRGRTAFAGLEKEFPDAALFQLHELTAARPASDVEKAIFDSLKSREAWQSKKYSTTVPEAFALVTQFEFTAGISGGLRQYLIVGAQTADNETQVLFKDLEYRQIGIGNLVLQRLLTPREMGTGKYIAVHSSRIGTLRPDHQQQLDQGVSIILELLEEAIGKPNIVRGASADANAGKK